MISELVRSKSVDLVTTLDGVKDVVCKVTDFWFRSRSFETPKFYERIGVRFFKNHFLLSDLVDFGQRFIRPSSLVSLQNLDVTTRLWEAGHLGVSAVCTGFATKHLIEGDYLNAGLYVGINMVGNVYPILLQRYNRARINRAGARMKQMALHD